MYHLGRFAGAQSGKVTTLWAALGADLCYSHPGRAEIIGSRDHGHLSLGFGGVRGLRGSIAVELRDLETWRVKNRGFPLLNLSNTGSCSRLIRCYATPPWKPIYLQAWFLNYDMMLRDCNLLR